MNAVRINERLTVAGQPEITDFPSLSAQGYKTIINARPDGEEPGQPGNAHERSAAGAAGLAYSFIPVSGPTMTEADIRAFQQTMAEAKGPIFAHCKGGTRALTLYVLGETLDGRMEPSEIG
ncbi:TIGR01244 family sulfur transferase, partial [Burkholderia sp. SIMBA_013]